MSGTTVTFLLSPELRELQWLALCEDQLQKNCGGVDGTREVNSLSNSVNRVRMGAAIGWSGEHLTHCPKPERCSSRFESGPQYLSPTAQAEPAYARTDACLCCGRWSWAAPVEVAS